jgi:hypothetical protein
MSSLKNVVLCVFFAYMAILFVSDIEAFHHELKEFKIDILTNIIFGLIDNP